MRSLCENQDLFQIILIKVSRDMFFFPFNKIYSPKTFFTQKLFRGMILAFYDIAIFDKYFVVLGSDLRASAPVRLITY